ncbi:GNAT family N-acetyltransferase [Paeniglutamicibacter antarcticus]|uniref:GNAT family N-acetyltransferase n=2 Tax=Arthrobacter terrae TaxID=2935737 RepID=A0A931CNF1_9MICC|nr:GNAT family N-acetyltransferase [Arthrobacter terrae]
MSKPEMSTPEVSKPAEFSAALHIMVAGRPAVAFARIEEVDGHAHLQQLSVLPDFAGQGIGRALVHAAAAWSREAGYRSITLCTFSDLPFNAPFYASCGFAIIGSPGPGLAALRDHERRIGLDAAGRRVVMQRVFAPTPSPVRSRGSSSHLNVAARGNSPTENKLKLQVIDVGTAAHADRRRQPTSGA